MAEYYGASEKYDELCEWYDGYRFGETEIFNPWFVIGYFNNECIPRAFWQATGNNDIISEVLSNATFCCIGLHFQGRVRVSEQKLGNSDTVSRFGIYHGGNRCETIKFSKQ